MSENADFIAKCLEERKQQEKIASMVDVLRKELRSQQEAVVKNDARVKKRESELKEKTQELRKLRADAANAKLQVAKVVQERDALKKKAESAEGAAEEREREQRELATLRQKYFSAVEDAETKDSELEAKSRELAIAQETVEQLKTLVANGGGGSGGDDKAGGGEEGGDGWDCEDAREYKKLLFNLMVGVRS